MSTPSLVLCRSLASPPLALMTYRAFPLSSFPNCRLERNRIDAPSGDHLGS